MNTGVVCIGTGRFIGNTGKYSNGLIGRVKMRCRDKGWKKFAYYVLKMFNWFLERAIHR